MKTRSRTGPNDGHSTTETKQTPKIIPETPPSSRKRKQSTGAPAAMDVTVDKAADEDPLPCTTGVASPAPKKPKAPAFLPTVAAVDSLRHEISDSNSCHDKIKAAAAVVAAAEHQPLGAEAGEASSSTSADSDRVRAVNVSVGTSKKGEKNGAQVAVPKGRSVSGRDWKVRNQSQRASLQVTTATETLSTSWAKKLEIKAKRKAIIAMEKEMKDRKRQEIEGKKQEKLEREKRRQQNEMKNTTFQTISKTHKLKAMSKKQLRQIKKRQVNARTGEVEFVSPWGGGKK